MSVWRAHLKQRGKDCRAARHHPPATPPGSSLHQDLARARPPAQYTPLARGLCVYPELLCLGTDAHHWAIGTTAGFGVRIF